MESDGGGGSIDFFCLETKKKKKKKTGKVRLTRMRMVYLVKIKIMTIQYGTIAIQLVRNNLYLYAPVAKSI